MRPAVMKGTIPNYQYKMISFYFLINLLLTSDNIIRVILNDCNTKNLMFFLHKRSIANAFAGTEMQSSTKTLERKPKFFSNIFCIQQIMLIYYSKDLPKFTSFIFCKI